LHLLNSSDVQSKIGSNDGRIAKLVKAKKPDVEILEELYLTGLGRLPRDAERKTVLDYVDGQTDKRAAWEDVAWAMVNTKEFLFNH
jgi:hypothetical protein